MEERRPVIGKDLVEITLQDGLYQGGPKYPRRVEGKTIFEILTNTDPEYGVSISQPEKIFIWTTSRDKGNLWINRLWQVAINDQETGIVYIADRKENVTYLVNIQEKTLKKIQGAKEGYRHTDKIRIGYMYLGEISDIVNQFISNGFTIKEQPN